MSFSEETMNDSWEVVSCHEILFDFFGGRFIQRGRTFLWNAL